MFGNFYSSAGVIANSSKSFNLVEPTLSWDFSGVIVFDYSPFGNTNESDRPRINVWRDAGGQADLDYLEYISGGRNVLSPMPTGRIVQPWGDRRTGSYNFPITSITYIKQRLSGLRGGDSFGSTIDLNDNGTVLVIGAPGSLRTGAYIYVGSPGAGGWSRKFTLTGDNTSAAWGSQIEISNDSSVIAMSGPSDNSAGSNAGSTIIFTGDSVNGWVFKQKLQGSINSIFGSSLSLDENGDVIVIGGPNNSQNATNAGATQVWQGDKNNGWVLRHTFFGNVFGSRYGSSVSVSKNGNVIAIGGPRDTGNFGSIVGGVNIYTKSTPTSWIFRQKLTGVLSSGFFGSSVSLNEDGSVIAVGAPNLGSISPNFPPDLRPQIFIFTGDINNGWGPIAKSVITNNCQYSRFGESVNSNYDGTLILAGAPTFNCNAPFENPGAAYVLTGTKLGGWAIDNEINFTENFSRYGADVKISKNNNIIMYGVPGNIVNTTGKAIIFNRSAVEKKEVIAGIDLFTHIFAKPIFLNPGIGEWEISNTIAGEIKYSYKFVMGEKNPGINIKLAYDPGCNVVIPTCEAGKLVVFDGYNNGICPIFRCYDPSVYVEQGSLYTTNNWVTGSGLAGVGTWQFASGSSTRRSIESSSQYPSPPPRASILDPSFFIVGGTGLSPQSHIINYTLSRKITSGCSFSIDVNYAWNGGRREVSFIGPFTVGDPQQRQFRFTHQGSDQLSYVVPASTSPIPSFPSTVIIPNVYQQAYRYLFINLGTGVRIEVGQYVPSKTVNSIPQLITGFNYPGSSNWSDLITGIRIEASLNSGAGGFSNIIDRNNFGIFFNNIQYSGFKESSYVQFSALLGSCTNDVLGAYYYDPDYGFSLGSPIYTGPGGSPSTPTYTLATNTSFCRGNTVYTTNSDGFISSII